MTRINLLPPEVRKERGNARLARRISVTGLALAALLAGLYGIRTWQVLGLRAELEAARTQRDALQSDIGAYAEIVAQQSAIASARGLSDLLLAGEVSWSEQMLGIASTVPPGVALTNLSGSISSDPSQPVIGSITWNGTSSDYPATEAWLAALSRRDDWANSWATSVQSSGGALTITGSVDLTSAAVTPRGGGPA